MGLLTIAYVKAQFPLWEKYFLDDDGVKSETVLQAEMDNADIQFAEYLTYTSLTITDPLKLHLMNIIKYRGFNRMLGDVAMETKPQIVRDYEATIAQLLKYKNGAEIPTGTDLASTDEAVKITAKDKRFGEWFNPGLADLTSPN